MTRYDTMKFMGYNSEEEMNEVERRLEEIARKRINAEKELKIDEKSVGTKMTLDEAIKYYSKVATQRVIADEEMGVNDNSKWNETKFMTKKESEQIIADNLQLAEWLTELKEAKGIIRVCNRVLGYLLECEIENTSTRHEVETLLKNITEYLSGGSENDT